MAMVLLRGGFYSSDNERDDTNSNDYWGIQSQHNNRASQEDDDAEDDAGVGISHDPEGVVASFNSWATQEEAQRSIAEAVLETHSSKAENREEPQNDELPQDEPLGEEGARHETTEHEILEDHNLNVDDFRASTTENEPESLFLPETSTSERRKRDRQEKNEPEESNGFMRAEAEKEAMLSTKRRRFNTPMMRKHATARQDDADTRLADTLRNDPDADHRKPAQETERKKRGPPPKNAQEVWSMRVRKAQACKTFKSSISSGPKLNGPLGLEQQSSGLREGREEAIAGAAGFLASVFPNDTIADRLAQPEGLDAAIIQSTGVKSKWLDNLIESVPSSVNKGQAKIERRTMLKASRSFGYGKVRSGEIGKWQFQGLRSQLYHHQLLAADFMVGVARLKPSQSEADAVLGRARVWYSATVWRLAGRCYGSRKDSRSPVGDAVPMTRYRY